MSVNQLSQNSLRKKLNKGEFTLGTCAYSFSPDIVQLAGYCGLDFCRIDNEHAWRQDSALENMIRAGHVADTSVMARVDKDNPYLIRKVLELGADAILIPQIENGNQVSDVIKAAKFPPKGKRGFGNLNQSGHYGVLHAKDWIEWSNTEPLVGVMIETESAVQEIDDIVSVSGLDYVTIGVADLSISLGLPKPEPDNPAILKCIQKIVKSAHSHGKWVMIGVGSPWVEQAKEYLDFGIDMIEIGHDYTILSTVWRNSVASLHGK